MNVLQVIYALERQEQALRQQADRLLGQGDYSAEFPDQDADRMREAIDLIRGGVKQTPLTDDAVELMWAERRREQHLGGKLEWFARGVRAAENSHGITRRPDAQQAAAQPVSDDHKALAQAAHKLRLAACSAWSDIMSGPQAVLPDDFDRRCSAAQAIETELIAAIDRLAAIPPAGERSTPAEPSDWHSEDEAPAEPGWYAVKRADGSLCLRVFGRDGIWWIPLKDGWFSGLPKDFQWLGPLAPIEWDTPRAANPPSAQPS